VSWGSLKRFSYTQACFVSDFWAICTLSHADTAHLTSIVPGEWEDDYFPVEFGKKQSEFIIRIVQMKFTVT